MDTLTAERDDEKRRLSEAIDAFAQDMKARASQKVDEGYTGWDVADWDVGWRIQQEIEQAKHIPDRARAARKCVDIALFSLFQKKHLEEQTDGPK